MTPEVAALQDQLLYSLKPLAIYADKGRESGVRDGVADICRNRVYEYLCSQRWSKWLENCRIPGYFRLKERHYGKVNQD